MKAEKLYVKSLDRYLIYVSGQFLLAPNGKPATFERKQANKLLRDYKKVFA